MNYHYDILLNFNSRLYDVFEWERKDVITHIRKIPFFKVERQQLYEILNYRVEFDDDFLLNIYKRTEYFAKNKINSIEYAFLVTDGEEVVAIKISKNKISYSKLLYEEEYEVLEYCEHLNNTNISYHIISKIKQDNFKTRNEIYIKNYIVKEINNMINNNDLDKLTYMYLECFNNKKPNNLKESIFKELDKNWDVIYFKIYNFLKLTLQKH